MNIKQPQFLTHCPGGRHFGLSGTGSGPPAAGSKVLQPLHPAAQPQVDDKAAREADKKRARATQDAITRSPRPRRL